SWRKRTARTCSSRFAWRHSPFAGGPSLRGCWRMAAGCFRRHCRLPIHCSVRIPFSYNEVAPASHFFVGSVVVGRPIGSLRARMPRLGYRSMIRFPLRPVLLGRALPTFLLPKNARAQFDRRQRNTPELVVEANGRMGACDALTFSADGQYLF